LLQNNFRNLIQRISTKSSFQNVKIRAILTPACLVGVTYGFGQWALGGLKRMGGFFEKIFAKKAIATLRENSIKRRLVISMMTIAIFLTLLPWRTIAVPATPGPVHGPPTYTAPTDSLSRLYTRSSTPPPDWTWTTDPDYLHTAKSTLFPGAPNNGTAYFMCGPNTVASLSALPGANVPLSTALSMLSASQVNAWSIDNKFLTVVTNAGGQDAILSINTGPSPSCTGYALVNGANGVATNGTDPTMSLTEPGVLYANATGTVNAWTMRWDLNANIAAKFIDWAAEAVWPAGAPPVGPSNAIGNLADMTGGGTDSMICAAMGPSAAPNTYTACKWLPTGAIAWVDVMNDRTGNDGRGLLFGPAPGFIPVACPSNCTGFVASTGIHAVSPGTDGVNLYAQIEVVNNEGVGPGVWKVGTLSLANATAISGGGHRSIVRSRIYSFGGGTPTTSRFVGVDLSNPTTLLPPVNILRLPCTAVGGTHCDDQHNSGIDCLWNVIPCWQTSGDYFANILLVGGAPYPVGTSPPSGSFKPTAIGADEVISISEDGSSIFRWTHKMQNGAIDCDLDTNGNCVGNSKGFYNLTGGNVAPCGCLYAYSSNYNGFWGIAPGAQWHTNYIFIMEMQAVGSGPPPIAPTLLKGAVTKLLHEMESPVGSNVRSLRK
jgi:hypothetical protein